MTDNPSAADALDFAKQVLDGGTRSNIDLRRALRQLIDAYPRAAAPQEVEIDGILKVAAALRFFQTVIEGGEKWGATCQTVFDDANNQLIELKRNLIGNAQGRG